jgi:DNA helicase HerA-like ATPase
MILTSQQIMDEIAICEKNSLAGISPGKVTSQTLLNGYHFVRVNSLGNFWEDDKKCDFFKHVTDFATGAHGYNGGLAFLVTGLEATAEVFYGMTSQNTVEALLRGAFPGIETETFKTEDILSVLQPRLNFQGMLSGTPSVFSRKLGMDQQPDKQEFYHLERLLRGMRHHVKSGTGWFYLALAHAVDDDSLFKERTGVLVRITNLASSVKQQAQQSLSRNENLSVSQSGEFINKSAEYALGLWERMRERMDSWMVTGRWQTGVYFGCTAEEDFKRLAALLKGLISGRESKPEPVRIFTCVPGGKVHTEFHTDLTVEELTVLIAPPREEMTGYGITDLQAFDVAFTPKPGKVLEMGEILQEGGKSGQKYSVQMKDIPRHGAIFGITGAGKTNTMFGILNKLRKNTPPVPFLIIEPAKTEYRALLGKILGGKGTGIIPDLRIYTLGTDTISPFRMNPFEFDLPEEYGPVPVLAQIDFLKAVFNAAFILYAPMPYVLETALYEIYTDKGWNLASETNVRLTKATWENREKYPIFPTLTDLYEKVETVTLRLGYEARIEQDVIAGLKARIGALRQGPKGLMLDTVRGIPMRIILGQPIVLELENIGSDDEKTFLIGMLLARLYGYRRMQSSEGKLPAGLQHVLVIEEAHRLLKNVSTQVDTESSNLRAQAVETFANMLSEVRHYGQGVLVAEQIPTKLTPDVIKNTNLKIIHRLLAEDDRKLVGETMNMSDVQIRMLATLKPGQAVVFAKDDDRPLMVEMDLIKDSIIPPLSSNLPEVVKSYTNLAPYMLTPDFNLYSIGNGNFGGPNGIVYGVVLDHIRARESKRLLAVLIARTYYLRSSLPRAFDLLHNSLLADSTHLQPGQLSEGLILWLVMGAALALQDRSNERNWPYHQVEALRLSLTKGWVEYFKTKNFSICAANLDSFVRNYEKALTRDAGPYPGCIVCTSKCTFGPEVARLMTNSQRTRILTDINSAENQKGPDEYADVRKSLAEIVTDWLGGECSEHMQIAYCAALTAFSRYRFDVYEQAAFAEKLARWIL